MRRLYYLCLCEPHIIITHNIYMRFCRVRIIIRRVLQLVQTPKNTRIMTVFFSFHRHPYKYVYIMIIMLRNKIYYNISFRYATTTHVRTSVDMLSSMSVSFFFTQKSRKTHFCFESTILPCRIRSMSINGRKHTKTLSDFQVQRKWLRRIICN